MTVSDRPTTLYFNISICQYFKLLCQLFQYVLKDPLKWVFCLPNMLPLLASVQSLTAGSSHVASCPPSVMKRRTRWIEDDGGRSKTHSSGSLVFPGAWLLCRLLPVTLTLSFLLLVEKPPLPQNRCLQLNCSAGSVMKLPAETSEFIVPLRIKLAIGHWVSNQSGSRTGL